MESPNQTEAPEYYFYDKKFVPAEFGMNNIGAICWCNSVIQMMLGLPSMNRTLLECEEELRDNPFAREYIKVLKATLPNSPDYPPADTTNLAASSASILGAFITQLRVRGFNLNIGVSQECVDEALVLFIDMFGCPQLERLFSNVYELIINCTGCAKKVSSIRDKSYRIQLFTKVKLETQDRFCSFLKVHPSECDYYKCECGERMVKFYRGERLKMLREIVVIIFNKFQSKDNRWFPRELKFNASGGKPPLRYKLVGKIEHSGNQFGGHYWAQSLRGDDWYRLNDTSVSRGDSEPSTQTFMVAYHIIDPAEQTDTDDSIDTLAGKFSQFDISQA
jgi:hypothetical protein